MTNAPELQDPIVWIDLEMTGLDPKREVIVEIAAIITDGQLQTVIEGPDIVISCSPDILANMDPFVVNMHATSGLDKEIAASTVTVEQAESQVLAFIRQHVPQARFAPLGGNSVHNDRAFLVEYMPALEAHLHYRNIDVSTIKELLKRWSPEIVANAPVKDGGHRALGDIRDSIEELQYYRKSSFR